MASSSQGSCTDISESEITVIVDKIGPHLLQLGRKLGVTKTDLTDIEQGRQSLKDKAYKLIDCWIHKYGKDATKDKMIDVLMSLGRNDIVDALPTATRLASKEQLFTEFIRQIKELYSHLSVPQPPGMHKDISIDKIFIDQEMAITKSKITPKTSANLQLQSLIQEIKENNFARILVEGDPGYGKTTLAYKLANDWAKERTYITSQFHLVLLIPLREVGEQKLYDVIVDFINRTNEEVSITRRQLNEYLAQHKVLILLDGYDEMSAKGKKVVEPVLKKNEMANTCILVTSRSGLFSIKKTATHSGSALLLKDINVEYDFWDCRLSLTGFTAEQQVEVLAKHFETNFEMLKKMNELYNYQVSGLFNCPLLVFWLGSILEKSDVKVIQTRTSFYQHLFNLILHKTLVREELVTETTCIDIFEFETEEPVTSLRKDIYQFGKIAIQRIICGNVLFKQSELKFLEKSPLLKSDFFVRYKNLIRNEEETYYQPMHRSFLEFLAAFTVCNLDNETTSYDEFKHNISNLVKQGLSPVADTLLFPFIAGLLDRNARWLFQSILPWAYCFHIDYRGMLNILVELNHVHDDLIYLLLKFVPAHYKMTIMTSTARFYYSCTLHKRVLQKAVENKLISRMDWCIDINPFPLASINLQTFQLHPNFFTSNSAKTSYSAKTCINCKELIYFINNNLNESEWNHYLAVSKNIKADQRNVHLLQCDSSTCTLILNKKADHWSNIVFHRFTVAFCCLTNDHIDLITQLVKENRIVNGINISLEENQKMTVASLIRLWEAVVQSTTITEFFFNNNDTNFIPIFQLTLPFDRKPLKYLIFNGLFSIEYTGSFENVNCIQALTFNNVADSSVSKFLANVRGVMYLGSFELLFSMCLANNFLFLSKLQELNLTVSQDFYVDSSFVNLIPSLKVLFLALFHDFYSYTESLEKFVVSVLNKKASDGYSNTCKLKILGVQLLSTSSSFLFIINCLRKVKTLNLNCLQLIFDSNENIITNDEIQDLKTLLKDNIKQLSIIDTSETIISALRFLLPVWFPEEQFQVECQFIGKCDEEFVYDQVFFRTFMLHSHVVYNIKMKK